MLKFLWQRTLQAFFVMFIISLIAFAIQSNLGDPLRELTGLSITAEEMAKLRIQFGLDDPFLTRYSRFIAGLLQGDLGTSYFYKQPALDVILGKLPATLELVILSTFVIITLSIPLGVYCAIHPKKIFSKVVLGGSIVGLSVPVFLTAILMIYLFSVTLGWLPSFGRGDTVEIFSGWDSNFFSISGWAHILMPALSLSSIMLPLFIRLIRAEMIEVLSSEYVRFATAKGMSNKIVWYKHALKNTMLPVVTVGGLQIGTMVAYTILTETVFQWPGMGFMFLEAIKRTDTPLITAYLIFVGLIFVLTNTIVDILYGIINPTISLTKKGA